MNNKISRASSAAIGRRPPANGSQLPRIQSAAIGGRGPMSVTSSQMEAENPFGLPSEDMIFTYKDDMKSERQAKRERESKLKVWEKSRHMREGRMKQLYEADIEPTAINVNPKLSQNIKKEHQMGTTIPIERPKHRDSRHNLIEKKREMFLV